MCSDGEHVVASGVDVPTRLLSDIRLGILGCFRRVTLMKVHSCWPDIKRNKDLEFIASNTLYSSNIRVRKRLAQTCSIVWEIQLRCGVDFFLISNGSSLALLASPLPTVGMVSVCLLRSLLNLPMHTR